MSAAEVQGDRMRSGRSRSEPVIEPYDAAGNRESAQATWRTAHAPREAMCL